MSFLFRACTCMIVSFCFVFYLLAKAICWFSFNFSVCMSQPNFCQSLEKSESLTLVDCLNMNRDNVCDNHANTISLVKVSSLFDVFSLVCDRFLSSFAWFRTNCLNLFSLSRSGKLQRHQHNQLDTNPKAKRPCGALLLNLLLLDSNEEKKFCGGGGHWGERERERCTWTPTLFLWEFSIPTNEIKRIFTIFLSQE